MVFVPKELKVAIGDLVEVKTGRPPEKGDAGLLNKVTRVIEKNGTEDGKCWWDPKHRASSMPLK